MARRKGGNRGSRGGVTNGRAFRVIGAKKREPGRPRKARRALTSGSAGVGPELRQAPARELEPVEGSRAETRTAEGESE